MKTKKKPRTPQDKKTAKWITLSIAVAIGIAVIALMTRANDAAPSPDAENTSGVLAHKEAPAFTLTDIQGRSVSLSDFRGKVVILDFWATWCPPCKKEIPDFIGLQKEYASRGLQIVGVGLDQPGNIKEFANANGMNYPVLLGNEDVSALYGGIYGIPTTFVIDKQGNIVNQFQGFTERSVFEQQIKSLL